jgi:hypothetical protein
LIIKHLAIFLPSATPADCLGQKTVGTSRRLAPAVASIEKLLYNFSEIKYKLIAGN